MVTLSRLKIVVCLVIYQPLYHQPLYSYPYDGFEATGIRRLERVRAIVEGKVPGKSMVAGAQKKSTDVKLQLLDYRQKPLDSLLTPDPQLAKKINSLFQGMNPNYSLSILVISPDKKISYAGRNETKKYQPGSVAKVSVAAGLFQELKNIYPDSLSKRLKLLKSRIITADEWIISDHHDVPFYDPATGKKTNRPLKIGDTFSLFEWVDHMLSASSNSAASEVWKECLLLRKFGRQYPPTKKQEDEFLNSTPKKELIEMAFDIVNAPMRQAGIPEEEWRLGSFFTRVGKSKIPGIGTHATTASMLKFLAAIETGHLVDEWSSLEIKKLMYMTARRIRYASSPALASSAVYFKSGSLYKCAKEEGYKCGKYMGNVDNYMNSVAIVERPDGTTYWVALMSNVLRKNSAADHQALASQINKLIP